MTLVSRTGPNTAENTEVYGALPTASHRPSEPLGVCVLLSVSVCLVKVIELALFAVLPLFDAAVNTHTMGVPRATTCAANPIGLDFLGPADRQLVLGRDAAVVR